MRTQETVRSVINRATARPTPSLRASADKEEGGCACHRAKALNSSGSAMGRTESLQRALLSMQQTHGNQYAQALLRSAAPGARSDSDMDAVENEIESARGGGEPLDIAVRARMENAFGQDFTRVRIHTNSRADALSRAIDARAFTTQQDVFFRQGEYNPGSSSGRALLAHELTHVVQQSGLKRKASVSDPSDPAEVEAEAVAREVMSLEYTQRLIDTQPAAAPRSPISRFSMGELLDDVAQGGSAIVSGAKSVASAASNVVDPEKVRAGLISQTEGAIAQSAIADSEVLVGEMPEVEQFTSQLGNLRAAAPASAAAIPMTLPALVPVGEAISAALTAIGAFLAGLALWEVVLIAVIVVAIIALAVYLYRQTRTKPRAVPKPTTDDDTKPKTKPQPDPVPKQKPDPTVDPIPGDLRRKCPAPTGYPDDPIDLNWFKPKYAPGYYP